MAVATASAAAAATPLVVSLDGRLLCYYKFSDCAPPIFPLPIPGPVCSRRHKLAQLSKSMFFFCVRFILIMRIYRKMLYIIPFIGLCLKLALDSRVTMPKCTLDTRSDHLIQIETKIVCIQLEREFQKCARLFSNKTNVPLHLLARKSQRTACRSSQQQRQQRQR